MKDDLKCDCLGCAYSEKAKDDKLPYRYSASINHILFYLTLQATLPLMSVFLIGINLYAIIPIFGYLAAYFLTSFFFCASCSYHHENVRFCGCFPKSIFSYKKYKKWGLAENLIGWPLVVFLLIGPTILLLMKTNDWNGLKIYLTFILLFLTLHGNFSCPNCRQRSVCFFGKIVLFLKSKLNMSKF